MIVKVVISGKNAEKAKALFEEMEAKRQEAWKRIEKRTKHMRDMILKLNLPDIATENGSVAE